ncbi:MAG: glycoside hydrolase family 18 protein [Bacteroidales bacterium]|nr:glycoside hydrolase family 18 protein [Bacteroidales bacterium]MDT8372943.1 glycoside hydrolase family 18 protein [Bacteroidales bacterium]
MKKLSLLFFSGFMLFMTSCINNTTGSEHMVVGYVAGFRHYDFTKIDATKLTHINYAFANIIDGRVAFGSDMIDNTDRDIEDIKTLLSLKEVNPDLKLLVSVGGWGWSGNFSDAALTDSSRNVFAASAAQFILDHGLDGIDLDWEYPNQVGAGNIYRPEDVDNFTLLLGCVRKHIDSLAEKLDRPESYLLTIATGGDSAYVANTELGKLEKYLDFINIMSYDYHNGLTSQAGHHSNLRLSASDYPHGDATVRSVRMHIDAGVSPAKLNIGVPFYGRRWKGVEPENDGLYREAATTGESIPYADVLAALADSGFVRLWDTAAAAPWLWNDHDSIFISYDDEESLKAKMEYVLSQGLGGVMFWEYTEDIDGMLLDAILEGLKGQ